MDCSLPTCELQNELPPSAWVQFHAPPLFISSEKPSAFCSNQFPFSALPPMALPSIPSLTLPPLPWMLHTLLCLIFSFRLTATCGSQSSLLQPSHHPPSLPHWRRDQPFRQRNKKQILVMNSTSLADKKHLVCKTCLPTLFRSCQPLPLLLVARFSEDFPPGARPPGPYPGRCTGCQPAVLVPKKVGTWKGFVASLENQGKADIERHGRFRFLVGSGEERRQIAKDRLCPAPGLSLSSCG